jgi:hypothetical protein
MTVPAVRKVQYVLRMAHSRRERRAGPTAGFSCTSTYCTFRSVGPAETVLDPVFGADHDARISSGQGRRQLAAFQRQSRARGAISPLASQLAGRQPVLDDLN